jgi:hypothetical protein
MTVDMTAHGSFARIAAAFLVGGTLATIPASAFAQTGLMKDVLNGFGLVPAEKPDIDYRERPALVVPPSRDLPAPEAPASTAVNPAWPSDPDVARREKDLAEKNRPAGSDDKARLQLDPRLSPDELRRGRVAGAPRVQEMAVGNRDNPVISPTELKRGSQDIKKINDNKPKLADRSRLSDPPTAYLQPSPTAPLAPDGEDATPGQKKSWLSKINPFD